MNHKFPWLIEYKTSGGYDCMTDAFFITEGKETVAVLDFHHYGQKPCEDGFFSVKANQNAHLIAAAPDLQLALAKLLEYPNDLNNLNFARQALNKSIYKQP